MKQITYLRQQIMEKGLTTLLREIEDDTSIVIEKGQYDIYPKDTVKQFYYQCNNDASTKAIAIHLTNKRNVSLDFSGSKLLFHGRITPVVVDGCENVTVKNVTIDYMRTFYSQGYILSASLHEVVLKMQPEFPYKIEEGSIVFTGENYEAKTFEGVNLFQEFDVKRKRLAYDAPLALGIIGDKVVFDEKAPLPQLPVIAEELEKGIVKLTASWYYEMTPGNVLVITHEPRHNSSIFSVDSKKLIYENITIRHSGAMGFLCQTCEDITLQQIVCALEDGSHRLVTTNCDATHFINCSGKIMITDCVFENMMDDGVNIHGIYTEVIECKGTRLVLKLKHYQQYGTNVYKVGDQLKIYHGKTVQTTQIVTVSSSRLLSEELIEVVCEEEIVCKVGDYVENRNRMPEVYIARTRTGNNRPRGFLITTPKKIIVEQCHFYNASFGIHIAGDTMYWYESGGVTDVTIRNNHFEDCGYQNTNYCIGFTPEYEKSEETPYFHRNVLIEENTFTTFTEGIVYAYGVDGLTFRNNTIQQSQTYKKRQNSDAVVVEHCSMVIIE